MIILNLIDTWPKVTTLQSERAGIQTQAGLSLLLIIPAGDPPCLWVQKGLPWPLSTSLGMTIPGLWLTPEASSTVTPKAFPALLSSQATR